MTEPDARSEPIEARLATVEAQLVQVSTRLEAIERGRPPAYAPPPTTVVAATPPPVHPVEAPAASDGPSIATLVGRTCVVLGGAFLLRSLTESEVVSQGVGVALGLAYAALWVLVAERAARGGEKADPAFHGVAVSAIAYPLVLESTLRFGVLGPWTAATLVLAFGATLLALAWRRDLRALAWVALSGALVTGAALLFGTHEVIPFAVLLLVAMLASLTVSYVRGWTPLRWAVAVVADVLTALLTLRVMLAASDSTAQAAAANTAVEAEALVALLIVLSTAYLGVFAWRILARGACLGTFEVGQSVFAIIAAFEGLPRILELAGIHTVAPSIAATVLGVGALGVLVGRWRTDLPGNAAACAAVAGLLLVEGLPGLLPGWATAAAWSAVAVGAAWLGRNDDRGSLRGLAAGLVVASCFPSGLAIWTARGLGIGGGATWGQMPAAAIGVAAASALAWAAIRWSAPEREDGWTWTAPGFVLVMTAVFGLGATLVLAIAPSIAGVPAVNCDGAALAAVRTGTLTAAVWALSWASRSHTRPELRWAALVTLAYAMLKSLAEDLPRGRASTLFLTFVLLGSTLMMLPRLTRHRAAGPAETPQPAQDAAPPTAPAPAERVEPEG